MLGCLEVEARVVVEEVLGFGADLVRGVEEGVGEGGVGEVEGGEGGGVDLAAEFEGELEEWA